MSQCIVEGCERPVLVKSRGLCDAHRKRLERHGSPTGGEPDRDGDLMARFLRYVTTEGDCEIWTGTIMRYGHGRFKVPNGTARGRNVLAHRWRWEHDVGPIAPGLVLRHLCGNPPCVKIEHLAPGTQKDNADDMVRHGRAWWLRP